MFTEFVFSVFAFVIARYTFRIQRQMQLTRLQVSRRAHPFNATVNLLISVLAVSKVNYFAQDKHWCSGEIVKVAPYLNAINERGAELSGYIKLN